MRPQKEVRTVRYPCALVLRRRTASLRYFEFRIRHLLVQAVKDQFSACYVIHPINRTLTSSLIAKRRLLAVGRQR